MRDVAPLYEMSALQLRCACLRLSYDALECLLWGPGEEAGAQVLSFEQALIDRCSGQIAIDGHAIGTRSWEGDLADKGYKFVKLGEEQANLLMALDVNTAIPFMSRFYEGGCRRQGVRRRPRGPGRPARSAVPGGQGLLQRGEPGPVHRRRLKLHHPEL
ncbi:hypothetical protein [Atopobium sp. oral taxon 416]|uniref:hypothetical protein n=1 Tax=Atopobium sp. oral taxon 416 TaxID=712157 RepID=UPI001BAA9177|nr:hypothetical protein [Atopobium sp. oral taxon 416]QUC03544.1 hypothetical protein J4859_00825 [Atopobium sp. oral taxon 416]